MRRDRPVIEGVAQEQPSTSVATRLKFSALPERVWDELMFYEQIAERPPWHLRLLLPLPIRAVGHKSQVGDESKCFYEGGHLVKRMLQIDRGRSCAFEVVEQCLEVGGGIRLSGGRYTLRPFADGFTEVALETRYLSSKHPRWIWKRIEAVVCHAFHLHILRTMRRNVESRGASDPSRDRRGSPPRDVMTLRV